MDCKVKFLNSDNLSNLEIRRLKIDFNQFKYEDFVLFLKNMFNIGETEEIYIFYKTNKEWIYLKYEHWPEFTSNLNEDSLSMIRLNMYYGNVHLNVECDICGYIVVGDRHKCLKCDNFDICQICFRAKPNIHKEHCFILLRTPSDCDKFFPIRSQCSMISAGGQFPSDVLIDTVLNLNVSSSHAGNHKVGESSKEKEKETGTDAETNISQSEKEKNLTKDVAENGINKRTDGNNATAESEGANGCNNDHNNVSVDFKSNKSSKEDCSMSQEDLRKLPPNIQEGLNTLLEMGFKNIKGPLIALLIEKNGNIVDVIEELEYSLNKK